MELVKQLQNFKTLESVIEYFATTDALTFWENIRFKDGYFCPKCGSTHVYKCKNHRFSCADCKNNFTATVGTIFASTKINLKYWFVALWKILNTTDGISSHQLARENGLSQKTNFYLIHKFRFLLKIHQVKTFGKFSVCSCGTHVVYNDSVQRYICPKCLKQYVSIQGRLIEEYRFTNVHYSVCFNSYRLKYEAKIKGVYAPTQSFYPKCCTRLGINDLEREDYNYIMNKFKDWDINKETTGTIVAVDEFYILSDCKKQKGYRRLLKYRNSQKLCGLVVVDQYNNTMLIPFNESEYNTNKTFTTLLQRYLGNETILVTDESNLYNLSGNIFVKRYQSSHAKKIFTVEDKGITYSSNICENNVKHFKRCIKGTYNKITNNYFDLYLATRAFRSQYNTNKVTSVERIYNFFNTVDFDTKITIKQLSSRLVA